MDRLALNTEVLRVAQALTAGAARVRSVDLDAPSPVVRYTYDGHDVTLNFHADEPF